MAKIFPVEKKEEKKKKKEENKEEISWGSWAFQFILALKLAVFRFGKKQKTRKRRKRTDSITSFLSICESMRMVYL